MFSWKSYSLVIFLLVFVRQVSFSQGPPDTVSTNNTLLRVDSIITPPDTVDKRPRNSFGDLLDDDPKYNPRTSFLVPVIRVTTSNIFGSLWARYVVKASWAKTSIQTWKDNLHSRWVWDDDKFGVNFLIHPRAGSDYFNSARSNGYGYWASVPFTALGSLEWEYFGENTKPSRNDVINTSISGAFLGEVLYRISSSILDDTKRGRSRVFREILAGIVNPTRALNRLSDGKMFRVTPVGVYQEEPLNVSLSFGAHRVNTNDKIGTGSTNAIINLQMDYGDPFEIRRRKPFDLFRLRLESRFGEDKHIVDNITGYGILFGKTFKSGKHGILLGIFQHYDYWDNKVFELGTIGIGPGIISRVQIGTNSDWYSGLHFGGVPLAGNSTRFGPDTSEFRDYPFGGGAEGRIEERLNLGNWVSIGFNGYYYWLFNYESSGKSRVGILKPFITVKLHKNISLGFEHHIYYDNRFFDKSSELHLRTTEQKLFVQIFFQDRGRYGKYH